MLIGKERYLYSTIYTMHRSQSAQTWITQFYLQITPCLPFLRKRSPDGATTNWGRKHPIAAYYSFIDPKRWKAELAWIVGLQLTVYPHKWSSVSYRSSTEQGKFAGQDRCSTAVSRNQPNNRNSYVLSLIVQTKTTLQTLFIAAGTSRNEQNWNSFQLELWLPAVSHQQ